MNKTNLKRYAPQARKDFIAAVTARANLLGLSERGGKVQAEPCEVKGDVALIGGRPWPANVLARREALLQRMQREGYAHTLEAVAYTWFNRLAALRYMELHDYLGHGRRVLSNPEGGLPEVLTRALPMAEAGDLPGLQPAAVRELKLANQDGELYRRVLIAQCNALHQAMPFLFEAIDDETELLLPDNLLLSDSIVAKLVAEIPEEDWAEVEVVGWLYQFYISEKKDQVIGKVVASEDIPAATQLFTPNWIVKYMVQNSLGAQWLATYPQSPLKGQMAYYIEPAEQTDEVKAQLAAITPSQLNPEELTLIDPASGSGHILVEAYELFKAIYLERGYRQRDVPQLILEKNLFGLDIDERAAQLTGFALMMKARADDRRLFERGVKLNVMALVDSTGFDAEGLAKGMERGDYGLLPGDLTELKDLFEHATTFGSLIEVPELFAAKLPALRQLSEATSQDLFVSHALKCFGPLVRQAELLAAHYDAVVANPPYMGSGGMNALVKKFAKDNFPDAKSDLFACFIERGFTLAKGTGLNAMVTMESWMFLSSYETFRGTVLEQHTVRNLAHFPYDGKKPTVMGINFGVAVISAQKTHVTEYQGHYCCSRYYELNDEGIPFKFPTPNERLKIVSADEFSKIPGSPVAYWASDAIRSIFLNATLVGTITEVRQGLATGENNRFLRLWHELSIQRIGLGKKGVGEAQGSGLKWFPYNKGGDFRKWYGNQSFVVNWGDNGLEIRAFGTEKGDRPRSRAQSTRFYFLPSLSWSKVTSGSFSLRSFPAGFIFDVAGCSIFGDDLVPILGCMNSAIMTQAVNSLSPTLNFEVGQVKEFPFIEPKKDKVRLLEVVNELVQLAKLDWDLYEESWCFEAPGLMRSESSSLESSYTAWIKQNRDSIAEMKRLEEENNRLFIEAYGLAGELTPEVPIEQITLTVNPAYRYGGNLTEEEQWTRFRQDTMEELVSYAIGCMMGRYSLDAPGPIYAHAGNVGFDACRYVKFPADADGILPLTEEHWFDDDAASRVREFLRVVWDAERLDQNMAWLAENLGSKSGETPDETIRRYLADKFFKDHLQTYKKRPIYWLFSSGKQGAFQALVYLHRYHEGTLARMRSEYVVPLTGKMQARIESLEADVRAAASTAARTKLNKQLEALRKQQLELLAYDEKLRHFADQRITLDLDDGVKVNYGKFGDLLAEVTAVTGGAADD